MAVGAIGGAVFEGNSKLFEGPLGVVRIGFNGYDLGKTTEDTALVPDQDIKDVNYQQEGTKAADHVRTGIEYLLSVTFGEIKTGLLDLLMAGISTANILPTEDSGTIDRSIYQSMRDNEGGVLRVAAVNEDGLALSDVENILNFYDVIPIVNGDLINWGADTQRNLSVEFRIKWHEFSVGESATKNGAFGYWGDPTVEDVPTITWPDVTAPILLTGVATDATTLVLTFDEDIAFNGAYALAEYVARVGTPSVDGIFVLADAAVGVIVNKILTLTFAAATFASGDEITISISSFALQDTDASPNLYGGIYGFVCTETI